jgi:type IV secretory pathway VirB9-like protein
MRRMLALPLTACLVPLAAVSATAQVEGIREVTATDRSLIPLHTRLRYTTMVVLPDGEEVLDVICGDRDFWVISATQNVVHVKPAKPGAETNLNLVTARGTIYSFLLLEQSGGGAPDLKVYVTSDAVAPTAPPKYYSAGEVERIQQDLTEARTAVTVAEQQAVEAIARERDAYPARLQFVYGTPKYERPFLVRAMWHDGQFTYVQADATELPALYELKDGEPAVLNFQVRGTGTYVVPKVLERGYFALGNARFGFAQRGR